MSIVAAYPNIAGRPHAAALTESEPETRNDPVTLTPYKGGEMTAIAQTWRKATRRGGAARRPRPSEEVAATISTVEAPGVEIAPNDPLVAYLQSAGGAVDVENLELESPAVTALREAGVALVVPLISGGELVGTLNLGPRLSDQQYSTDDKRLLDGLAAQAAPALQVAELVQKQASEARERERIEQEPRSQR